MKSKQILGSALIALAVSALFTPAAQAAGGNNDLYLGFADGASTNDYVVDIGAANTFTVNSTFSINLNADLGSSSEFGSGYYTADPSLTFGLAGYSGLAASSSGLYLSEDATTGAIAPETGLGTGGTSNSAQQIASLITGFNDAPAAGSTPSPVYGVFSSNVSNAVIQPAGESTPTAQGNSFKTENPNVNAFGTGYDITTAVNGGTLDLYKLPKTSGGAATFLGTATVSSAGIFTFDGAAVPEPSTYGLMALGLGALAFLRRRLSA